jgi:transcriptional regulator with XRE-family HTH domain
MARNSLLTTPPYPVESALRQFGANLRTARLRRGLTIAEVAQKIGTGVRAVADAEKGKPSTGIAVHAALLWTFGLLADFEDAAAPNRDEVGLRLARSREGERSRHKKDTTSNDF